MAQNGTFYITANQYGIRDGNNVEGLFTNVEGMHIGGGVTGIAPWQTSYPFSDVVKHSQGWVIGSGSSSYTIDDQDRVTSLSGDTVLSKSLNAGMQDPTVMPAGSYVFRKTGTGEWDCAGSGFTTDLERTITLTEGQVLTLQVRNGTILSFEVIHSDNIAQVDAGNPWRPQYLAYHQALGVKIIRNMDWFNINQNMSHRWNERTLPVSLSFVSARNRGGSIEVANGAHVMHVPVDYQVDLCNRLETDLYFNVPTRYSAESITSVLTYVRNSLSPSLKLYIAISNETWNNGFYKAQIWSAFQNIPQYTLSGTAGSNSVTFTGSVIEGEQIRLIGHEDNIVYPDVGQDFFENENVFTLDNVSGQTADLNLSAVAATLPEDTSDFYFYKYSEASEGAGNARFNNENVDFGTAALSLALWSIVDTVFLGQLGRVEKVIETQGNFLQRTVDRIGVNGTNGAHDIVAAAPYYGFEYTYPTNRLGFRFWLRR
jgi:hypothetical protein